MIEKKYKGRLSNSQIENAVSSGLNYLNAHQLPNGEFCCYYSPDDAMQEWCVPYSTVFPTALITTSLLALNGNEKVEEIFEKAIAFFQFQMMRNGVWNYFTKWNKLFALTPPDVDDTIFIYNFLRSQNIETPDPTPLILANKAENGLFYTWFTLRFRRNKNKNYWLLVFREFKSPIKSLLFWIVNNCRRNDIDAAVNANLLSFLGKSKETQPIIDYLSKLLTEGNIEQSDGWYRNPIVFYYLFSKNARLSIEELEDKYSVVIESILNRLNPNGSIGNSSLETALGISTLINLKYHGDAIQKAINFLLQSQDGSGAWPRFIFFYSGPKQVVGWGSEELTTGFCLEALSSYSKYINFLKDESNEII